MDVTATFEYDSKEHYRALRDITNLTPYRWVTVISGVVLPLVAVAVIVWIIRARDGDPLATFMDWLPYILLFFVWAAILPLSQWRMAKRLPTIDASARGPQERGVDSIGYHQRGNGVALEVPWHAFKKAVETDRFFIFFYTRQCGYYLPKRTLSASDISAVRQIARTALGERARVRV